MPFLKDGPQLIPGTWVTLLAFAGECGEARRLLAYQPQVYRIGCDTEQRDRVGSTSPCGEAVSFFSAGV